MTATAPRTHQYNHAVPGPELQRPFTVASGFVIVAGLDTRMSVTIPTGGTWPGLGQLPGPIVDRLNPTDSTVTVGTIWVEETNEDLITAGHALVLATMLRSVPGAEAITLLNDLACPTSRINQTTLAHMLGRTRETVTKLLSDWRRARTDVSARVPHA